MLFGFKKKTKVLVEAEIQKDENRVQKLVPRICIFGFDEEKIKQLNTENNNIYLGDLGKDIINIPNNKGYCHYLKLQRDIPKNIHEYPILAFNMGTTRVVDYKNIESSIDRNVKSNEDWSIKISFPQTVFFQKNHSLYDLSDAISNLLNNKGVLIVFASENENHTYDITKNTARGYEFVQERKLNTYSFINSMPSFWNIEGYHQEVVSHDESLSCLLNDYLESFEYKIAFNKPSIWNRDKDEYIDDLSFSPLMTNEKGQITGFLKLINESLLIVLPSTNKAEEIFMRLIHQILPDIFPSLFPESELFSWVRNDKLLLPETKELLDEEKRITERFKQDIGDIKNRIKANNEKYAFLHNILKETGGELVSSIKNYLEWLGFSDVKVGDDEKKVILEEDLSFNFNGVEFLIEVKGIGGTSKDHECSQILKNVNRYMRENNSNKVKGVYIVNHQRFMSPLERSDIPFQPKQIEDAIHDERLMITTFGLFKLYNNINEGLLDSSWARDRFFENGFQNFLPDESLRIGKISKTYQNDLVGIVIIEGNEVHVDEEILVLKNDKLEKFKILKIEQQNKSIEKIREIGAEVGLEFSKCIKKNSILYKIP